MIANDDADDDEIPASRLSH